MLIQFLKNSGIIWNRKKVESFVNNAKKFLEIKDEFGTFNEYICGQFVSYKTAVNRYTETGTRYRPRAESQRK